MLVHIERMHEKMDQFGLDAVIASFPENVSYFSGLQSHYPYMYRHFHAESYAVIARRPDVPSALIIYLNDVASTIRHPTAIKDLYVYGNTWTTFDPSSTELSDVEVEYKRHVDGPKHLANPAQALVQALKDRGLQAAKIALDERGFSPATRERVISDLPKARFVDGFDFIRLIRMVKSAEEIARLREVGARTERAVVATLDRLAEGVSEAELTQAFMEAAAKEGMIFEFWNSVGGTQSSLSLMSYGHFHPTYGYRLKKGDLFRWDAGCIYNQYHSDLGGCAVVGEPSRKQLDRYRAVSGAMDHAISLMKPGAVPSKIYEEVVKTALKMGLSDYKGTFCGHGIGIECRDFPTFSAPSTSKSPYFPGTTDVPLEKDMVISLEFPYGELGLGGFQAEYTMLITKNGCEPLYPHERPLVVR